MRTLLMAEPLLAVVETPQVMAVMTWKDSLRDPTNNNRESANFDVFSRFLANSGPIISLLGKINLSVLSDKSLGYNLRKIGFTQSFTKLYRLCSIKYQFYLLKVKLYLIISKTHAKPTIKQ